jgi:hypothetical protein
MNNEITLGGNTFVLQPLLAKQSWMLQPRIAPPLLEVFRLLPMVQTDIKSVLDLDTNILIDIMNNFFKKLPPDEIYAVTSVLLTGATMDGKPLFTESGNPFDILMRNRTIDTWRLLWFAIQLNYADFFMALGAKSGKAKGEASRSAT